MWWLPNPRRLPGLCFQARRIFQRPEMVRHSCRFLYLTLWDKLWHVVKLRCLFMAIAKKHIFPPRLSRSLFHTYNFQRRSRRKEEGIRKAAGAL